SPAGLHTDAGAPVLIGPAAEPGRTAPAGGGALLELDGADVQVTVIAGGRRVSRHVLGTPATAGGDPRRSWVPASWQAQGAEEVLLVVEALEARGGMFREVRRAPTDRGPVLDGRGAPSRGATAPRHRRRRTGGISGGEVVEGQPQREPLHGAANGLRPPHRDPCADQRGDRTESGHGDHPGRRAGRGGRAA